MSKSYLLSSSIHLFDEIVSHLDISSADFSRNIVVFPGKRPSHFLLERITETCKKSYLPPCIFSIDEFIDFFYTKINTEFITSPSLLDAVIILFDVYRAEQEHIGETHFLTLEKFLPLGIKMFHELEELHSAMKTPHEVNAIVSGLTYGKLFTLSSLYEKFYTALQREHFYTRAMKYNAVASLYSAKHTEEFQQIILAGFFGLTQAEKTLFIKLSQSEHTVFIFQKGKGIRRVIDELNLTPEIRGENISSPEIHFTACPDIHGQIYALHAWMEQNIHVQMPTNESSVIVLPASSSLFPLLHQSLSSLQENEYNISLGYALRFSPMYSFYSLLLDVIATKQEDKFFLPSYLKFVLHPYTKNIYFKKRADVTRILFHSIEEHCVKKSAGMFFSLHELENEASIFATVASSFDETENITAEEVQNHLRVMHEQLLKPLLSLNSVADFARKSIAVFKLLYYNSTARRHPFFSPFAEQFIHSFEKLTEGRIADVQFDSTQAYFTFIKEYLQRAEVHFPGTPLQGLQVLGFLETRNLQFDNVCILDMNDDVFPGTKDGASMILPQQLRLLLGMETIAQRENIIEYYFDVLIQKARNVYFFYADDFKREKSRFIEKILWEQQRGTHSLSLPEKIKNITYQLSLANFSPPPIPKTDEMISSLKNLTYTSTALDEYLRCGLKFYYKYVLRLYEKDEITDDIESNDIGTLLHEVLHEYFSSRLLLPLDAIQLSESALIQIFENAFLQHFGTSAQNDIIILKYQIEKQLRKFLAHYQLPKALRETIIVQETEIEKQISLQEFSLKTRIDRIEQRGENIFILDYKTGGSVPAVRMKKLIPGERETWNDAVDSVQLYLNALIYSYSEKIPIEKITPAYLHMGTQFINESSEKPLFKDSENAAEHYGVLYEMLCKLLQEIIDGEKKFLPASKLEKACPYCSYKNICGTQWVQRFE